MLADHDDRLVAINDDATKAFVWSFENKEWVKTSPDYARKAWLEGSKISEAEAAREFPEADMKALPEFA